MAKYAGLFHISFILFTFNCVLCLLLLMIKSISGHCCPFMTAAIPSSPLSAGSASDTKSHLNNGHNSQRRYPLFQVNNSSQFHYCSAESSIIINYSGHFSYRAGLHHTLHYIHSNNIPTMSNPTSPLCWLMVGVWQAICYNAVQFIDLIG